MIKILFPLITSIHFSSFAYEPQEYPSKLPILISKVSTLVFPHEIIDVETPSPHYHLKVKGRYLLLRAKSAQAPPSSIFVRFGKEKNAFVAEIFPHNKAPLQHTLGGVCHNQKQEETLGKQAPFIAFDSLPQQYFDCGVKEKGLQIILTNLLHTSKATLLRLFTYNNTAMDLLFDPPTFAFVSLLPTSFFRRTTKTRIVEPIMAPDMIAIAHQQGAYLVFALPLYAPQAGLRISFSEKQGERNIELFIPAHVLLKAQ